MRKLDTLLDEVVPVVEEVLTEAPRDGAGRWLLVKQADNLVVSDADTSAPPYELLAREVDGGADGAVVISWIRGYAENVLAYVLAADPRDSDIRRSHVARSDDGAATLSAWEYTV